MHTDNHQLSTRIMLQFYAPLAATAMLMMATHSVVSGALSRTADPVLALAAYSAAMSIGLIFESPCHRMQQMGLVFAKGRDSFRAVSHAAARISIFLVLGLFLLGWTPLSEVVFFRILRTPEAVYPHALMALRFFMLWPVASTVRAVYQSRIVMEKRTIWMTANMLVRVTLMLLLAIVLPPFWPHLPVGAIILVAGLGMEAVLALLVAFRLLPPLGADPTDKPVASTRQVLRFFLPLSLAAMVQTLGRPVLTAALSRTFEPEVALSAYYVSSSFAMIFAVPIYNVYHLSLVYIKDQATAAKVRRFILITGAAASGCLALASLPGVGHFIMGRIIGVPQELIQQTMATTQVFAFLPITIAQAEFFGNLLTLSRRTVWVTAAKLANIGLMSVLSLFLASHFPHLGSTIGAIAMVCGSSLDATLCYTFVMRFPDCRRYVRPEGQAATG